MPSAAELDALAIDAIRALSMDAVEAANSGHPGTPMALAPLGWSLFSTLRRHDPANPDWPDRDRFVLSCGHASMLQYALLYLSGYGLTLEDLRRFRQWESRTPGHPEYRHTAGVETTTGPLGQGIGNAVGLALAERHLAARFNRPGHRLIDHAVFVIASDGDLMEGVAAEAASLAGHLQLGKLIVFWDDNRITIDGSTDLSFSENVVQRFDAYGWNTASVEDGNDLGAIATAVQQARQQHRPTLVRVRTVIAFPSPGKQGTSAAHGAPLGAKEVQATKDAMGWKHGPFELPPQLQAATQRIAERGASLFTDWQQRLGSYRKAYPTEAATLDEVLAGRLPSGFDTDLPAFAADPQGQATRQSSGAVLQALAQRLPQLVGGSADLAASNNTYLKGCADFGSGDGEGVPRNVHWGVREHAMAAAINGMALHGGVVPFGATFLIFSDYMRPALRLAALMQLPTRYIFTHDSIGVGEDGPTHQPVEQLAGLRSIPGMTTFRPADANEVRECWVAALRRRGPAALVLTRQKLPTIDRQRYAAAEGAHRGAYVLAEATGGSARVVLIATGSEVHLALAAQDALHRNGTPTRVVSMPSWELFSEQSAEYQSDTLLRTSAAHVVIEAASRFGWDRWVGADASFVTLEHFGASAPAEILFERFGFSIEGVVAAAQRSLDKTATRH